MGCAISIWFGFWAKDNAIYGIVGEAANIDLQNLIFLFCLIIGILLLFLMCCGFCTSAKRICFFHYVFAILLTLFTIFFLFLGITLMAIGIVFSDQLEELCDSNNQDSDFQSALSELYSRCDSFYCTSDCPCYIGSTFFFTGRTHATTNSGDNTNVQACRQFIEQAYSGYSIDFSDLDDIITYLNFFGEIEKEYSCSGICVQQSVYYFGDASLGKNL